jgi:hypothetical protein
VGIIIILLITITIIITIPLLLQLLPLLLLTTVVDLSPLSRAKGLAMAMTVDGLHLKRRKK